MTTPFKLDDLLKPGAPDTTGAFRLDDLIGPDPLPRAKPIYASAPESAPAAKAAKQTGLMETVARLVGAGLLPGALRPGSGEVVTPPKLDPMGRALTLARGGPYAVQAAEAPYQRPMSDEELTERVLEKASPEALAHPNVLATAGTAGTVAKELGYIAATKRPSQAAGRLLQTANAAERAAAPGVTRVLDALAGRSTLASRATGAVSGAAEGAVTSVPFAVGRELAEGTAPSDIPAALPGYAMFGATGGALFGAVTARQISAATKLLAPKDAIRARAFVSDDPYTVLGIDREASLDEVGAAVRRAAQEFHPDVNPAPEAAEVMSRYTQAAAEIRRQRAPTEPVAPEAPPAAPPKAAAPPPPPPEPYTAPQPKPGPFRKDMRAHEAVQSAVQMAADLQEVAASGLKGAEFDAAVEAVKDKYAGPKKAAPPKQAPAAPPRPAPPPPSPVVAQPENVAGRPRPAISRAPEIQPTESSADVSRETGSKGTPREQNVDRFVQAWEPELRKAIQENPEDYGYKPGQVDEVKVKQTIKAMRNAFLIRGSYNHSATMKAAQRKLGMPTTTKALEGFFEGPVESTEPRGASTAADVTRKAAPGAFERLTGQKPSVPEMSPHLKGGPPPERKSTFADLPDYTTFRFTDVPNHVYRKEGNHYRPVEGGKRLFATPTNTVIPEPTEPKQAETAPVVQRTLEQEGEGASPDEIRHLIQRARSGLNEGTLPKDSKGIRKWAGEVLGRPYESRTWTIDDAHDAIEGALNQYAYDTAGPLRRNTNIRDRLEMVKQIEERVLGNRLRSEAAVARMQFSTPLPMADAAAYALDVLDNEKVLEPSGGTGNLVNALPQSDRVSVNEIDPRRAAVLRHLGYAVTTEDALRLPLTGKRYNAVAMNPPFGGKSTGKYSGFGATPFDASDVSQRHVYAALQSLVPGGRLVSIMPQGLLNASATPFKKWLRDNYNLRAMITSPEGIYKTRGTDFGTVMLVVDKTNPVHGKELTTLFPGQTAPTWEQWVEAVEQLGGGGEFRRANEGRDPAVDVAPTAQAETAKGPKREAALVGGETGRQIPSQEVTRDADETAAAPADRGLAPGDGEEPAPAVRGGAGLESGRPAPGSGRSAPAGSAGGADVVAGEAPADVGAPPARPAESVVLGLAARRVEPTAGDSPARRAELQAANNSAVFAPYARGIPSGRNPHPRLVVETRSMAGMPAPPITAKFQSPIVETAWDRPGSEGGVSDDQAEVALRVMTAWDRGHGMLIADDVGVGKSREFAILALEALARGSKRILFTTKNETNVADAMKEFRLVASGSEEGDFPAEFVFVGEYPNVRKGLESLPLPKRPTIYFAHAYNFEPFAKALAEVGLDTWLGDEAHEYKNQFAARGVAWQALHAQLLAAEARFAYGTATPAVTLDELGYLYGLKEWVPGGFADWVRRKLGKDDAVEDETGEVAAGDAEEQAANRALGERSGVAELGELAADDKDIKSGKKRFMRNRPDIFQSKITPAETEQVMRELKGKGKYIARDLWRGGVKFEVHEFDLMGDGPAAVASRERYDAAASLSRDISKAGRKFGAMNKQVKTAGLDRSMIQSYMKQLLFELRLPEVLRLADVALGEGKQVVISVSSVAGDADLDEGLSEADAEVPLNRRLESAINRINTREVAKEGEGDEVEFIDMGEIPEALAARAELLDRLKELAPLSDPVRRLEEHFGARNVAAITGKVPAKMRTKLKAEFQAGRRTVALISKAGKVGISLDDVNGKTRKMIVADYEWSADLFKQELGRVDRASQRSSPEITLVASNIAGERKFAATIAARMASLGATSKGSAESTGTDALDQFEMSGDLPVAAMKNAVSKLDDHLRSFFTGSKFVESKKTVTGEQQFIPKRRPDDADMRSFLLEMLMFPVKESDRVLQAWVAEREDLMTGEAQEALQAKRTGRSKGDVLRVTELSKQPPLTLIEVKNAAGEQRGIVQGFVTEYIKDLQEARGRDENNFSKSRRYVQFTDEKTGGLLSGLEVSQGEARRIRDLFGAGDRASLTPDDVFNDLMAGDKAKVDGPKGSNWILSRRRDGRIQITGATVAKHRDVLKGLAKYEPVGNFLFIPDDEAAVKAFLDRFPPKRPEGKSLPPDADLTPPDLATNPEAGFLRIPTSLNPSSPAGQAVDAVEALLSPASRTPEAGHMARIIRAQGGKGAREFEVARAALGEFRKAAPSLTTDEGLEFVDAIEAGQAQATPELQAAATALREALDAARTRVQDLGTGKLETWIDNYFPHIWEKSRSSADIIARILGKRPLEGSKSFLKRRTIPTTREGMDAGLKPVSDNPVDLVLLKIREMNRYVMAHRIKQESRDEALIGFVKATERAPDGWKPLDDRVFTAFGPMTSEGAQTIRGRYWAPEPVARIVNNYLSPGLRGNVLYDAYMGVGNVLNQAQLGLSAFHLGFTSLDAAISRMALSIEQVASGSPIKAAGTFASVPLAPITNLLKGNRVLKEYMAPGTQGAEIAQIVDALVQGGGRVKMDDFYKNNAIAAFLKAVGRRDPIAATVRAIPAALELASKPIMEWLVPRQKLGVFFDLAQHELGKLPATATVDDVRAVMAAVWDSVDNRMGQLVYDNLFWDKTLKDLAMGSVRSLGWNIGSVREALGGARDISRGRLSHKAAYVIALPILVGMIGAIITYLYTGEGPKELKDYYYPRTGRKNADGTDERIALPSYMKDVFAFARHPVTTVQHKLHPLLTLIADMLQNKDFYGDQIRNPDDPLVIQAEQVAERLGQEFVPFGIRGALQESQQGQSGATQALPFIGVTPAPREVTRSKAANLMSEILSRRTSSATPEEADERQLRGDLRRALQQQEPDAGQKIIDAIRSGEITREQGIRLWKGQQTPATVSRFKQLTIEDAVRVYRIGTPAEQQQWWPLLAIKARNAAKAGNRQGVQDFQALLSAGGRR